MGRHAELAEMCGQFQAAAVGCMKLAGNALKLDVADFDEDAAALLQRCLDELNRQIERADKIFAQITAR